MTALDMVIQLIFPIAAIPTTRSHAAENPGVSLVLLGMAFEFTLTFERTVAFGASVAGWSHLSGAKGSGIVVDDVEGVWEYGTGCRLGGKAMCSKLASVNIAAVDSAERRWIRVRGHKLGMKAICRERASVAVTIVDGVGRVEKCTSCARVGVETISW